MFGEWSLWSCVRISKTNTYDLAITPIRTQAGGCLTTKRGCSGRLFLRIGRLFLLTFFTFVTFFTTRNFYKLLFTTKRGKVCYFLLLFYCL